MWMGAVTLSALAACGDSGKGGDATKAPDGDATTGDAGDGGDTGDAIVLPTDCYLPAAPLATMDCDLMCRKVAACGAAEADCLTECAELTYLLNPDAAARVESCFVDLPCNGGPAVFGAVGCIARLADDATYHAPSADSEGCAALETKVESCALAEEVSDAVKFQCDKYATGPRPHGIRRAACADRPCDEVATCIAASSCAWKDLPTGSTTNLPGHDECSDETSAIVSGGAVSAVAVVRPELCRQGQHQRRAAWSTAPISRPPARTASARSASARTTTSSPCATGTDAGCYAPDQRRLRGAVRRGAGLPIPGSPADTTCTAADRTAIAASGDITESVGQCVDQQTRRSCADDRMTVVLDASDRRGATSAAARWRCARPRRATRSATARRRSARACLDASVRRRLHDLQRRRGDRAAGGRGALGVGDQTQADDGTAWDATATCAAIAWAVASCIADCVAATQLSDGVPAVLRGARDLRE
ncbi:MAG: hypothetical protein U1F43_11045 [Myxococcota bacterium]